MSNAEYFKYFPEIEYQGYKIKDIMRRTKITEKWDQSPLMFLPYTVQGDETAEDVAYLYYGDPHYVWLIYLANKMINPYEDWVMGTNTFKQFLIMKYKAKSGQTDDDAIINWTKTNKEFYVNEAQTRITPYTYDYSNSIIQDQWTLVTTYDFEEWKNESKRNIRMVNASLLDTAIQELKDTLNGR